MELYYSMRVVCKSVHMQVMRRKVVLFIIHSRTHVRLGA